jgi:hypothetical protein
MRMKTYAVLGLLAVALVALPGLSRAASSLSEAIPEPLDLADAVGLSESLGGPSEHPDANSIIGLDHTWVEFDETGAYEQYGHTFTKVLTDEGRDRDASVSITYHRRYGSVEIVLARVIKADGTEVVVGEDLITEGTPPEVSAMNIFETDFRQITVVFPGLEIGDATELLVHESYEPLIDGGFNGIYFLQYTEPIVATKVTIIGPTSLPLVQIVKDGDAAFAKDEDGDRTVYEWTATNVPKIEREMMMVSPAQIAERLIVSTMQSWQEMSRYMWKMVNEKCVVESSIKDIVDELTEGLTTEDEKIRAIHFWILQNVRYLGIAMDRGAFLEPHFAAYTLEKGYGVCRDKATLMITMLKEIGVPAWMVAINPSHRTDPEIATIYFEHGIVAIKGDDGEYRYIDPTMEETREVYANYVGDRYVLVATEEGEDLKKAPHVPASENSGKITDNAVLDESGGIEGQVTIAGNGFYELILRSVGKSLGEQQLRMRAEAMVQSIYPGAELVEFSTTDPEDLDVPTALDLSYSIDDYALDADPYVLFKVPAAKGSFELLSDYLFGRITGLEKRKYPVSLGVTLGVDESSEVSLPPGYVVENLPDAVDFKKGAISLSMTYEYLPRDGGDGGLIRYNRKFAIESFQISPEDYLNLKEAVKLAGRSEKGEVILKREEG